MKKVALLSITILLNLNFALAQEEDPQIYKRDVGFNTTFIVQGILQSDQTPFSLMFKKYVAENKAIRIGLAAFFNLDNTHAFSGSTSYYNTSVGSLYLTIGKEYQKPIDKRWTWYFGGDSVPFFSFNNQDLYQSGNLYSESESSSVGVSLRPFLGIRFNLNPRLYLSAEANVGLTYAYTKNMVQYVDTIEPFVDRVSNNFSFTTNPASGLFLYYRF
jgi:hypothetical protein